MDVCNYSIKMKLKINFNVLFLKLLGHKTYSVIGWSDGAKVAIMMGIRTNRIKCLIVIAIFIRVSKETLSPILWSRNTKNWDKNIYDSLYPIYGDSLQLYWDEYLNSWKDIADKFTSGYLTDDLASIRCPVLLTHGDQVLILNELVYN
jgi:pimeloyl-ACP methyl ester carboxylesterase